MRTTLAGLAAAVILTGIAAWSPTRAAPLSPAGLKDAKAEMNNAVEVRYRRRYVRRHHWRGPRYGYWGGAPYYGYGYYPSYYSDYGYYPYRYYRPGPFIGFGFGGLRFGFW